jgi:4-diphosphocytidyl-2C-methyl-D-erythritol kinase
MTKPLFASFRKYNSAPTLADELSKKQDEIKTALKVISGFHAYYLMKTGDGAVSVTLCENRNGAEESNRVEATWLKDKFPTFASRPPEITIGDLRIELSPEMVPVRV